MFLILWMGEQVVALWGVLFYATSSELDALVLTLVILCVLKELVLIPIKKEIFRCTERMLEIQLKSKDLEDKYASDADELSRAKAALIVEEGVSPVRPPLLFCSTLLVNALIVVAVFLVFWMPHSFAEYTIIDDLYSADFGGYVLQINQANLFEQLFTQLNKSSLNWGGFIAAELFVLLFGRFADQRTIRLKPGAFQVSTIVLLFLPAGLWLSRMIFFCIAWPFGFLFEQWKAEHNISDST